MAQNFRRTTSNDVGTSVASVYTADSYDTIIGIALTNVASTSIKVSAYINDGTNDIYLIKDAPIPVGSSLVVVGGDQKLVLNAADHVMITSSEASSVDVVTSYLEIS